MSIRTTCFTAPSRATEPLCVARTESLPTATLAPWRASALARFASVQEQTRQLATADIFLRAAIVLLAIDAILVTLHVLRIFLFILGLDAGMLDSNMFAVTEDYGYGESFGYLKSIAITLCFLICYFRDRTPVFLALSFAFLVIILDDSMQIHEGLGAQVVAALALEPMGGLRAQDFGELMVWFALGTVVAAALAIGFLRSDVLGQSIALIFVGLLAVLVFFAVGMDMVHEALGDLFRGAGLVWALLEDGGEMVTLSVIAAAAVALAWCGSPALVWSRPAAGRPLP